MYRSKDEEVAMDRKRIVVIGGGVAGSTLAKSFESDANVTLIDPYVPSYLTNVEIFTHACMSRIFLDFC